MYVVCCTHLYNPVPAYGYRRHGIALTSLVYYARVVPVHIKKPNPFATSTRATRIATMSVVRAPLTLLSPLTMES